jgi:hypothetical protein
VLIQNPWLPASAAAKGRVDKMCRRENSMDDAPIEWAINWIWHEDSLRELRVAGINANTGEVEAEIQNNDSRKPDQKLFSARSHGV